MTSSIPARAPSEPVGIAVIGLGRIGRVHARNLVRAVPSGRLVRVVDLAEPRAAQMGAIHDVPWSTSCEAVAEDERVEAVVIATPVATHAPLIEMAASAGKHVLCEKPLAADVNDARRGLTAARMRGVQLQVGFQLRCDPDIAAARDRIVSGELGDVRFFRASLRDMAAPDAQYLDASGGLFLDGATHTFDLARWMVGDIEEVTAFDASASDLTCAAAGDSDTLVIAIRFAGGTLGVIEHSRVAGYGFECAVEVVGSRATVRVCRYRRTHLQWLTPGKLTVDHAADFVDRFGDAYALELESFAFAIRHGLDVRTTGEDGLAALILSLAAQASAKSRRAVVIPQPGQAARSASPASTE